MPESLDKAAFRPIASNERIVVIDVLRGFALLGIAIINMSWFSLPNGHETFEPRPFQEAYNKAAGFLALLIFAGKANSIFSFLFGLGLTIQIQRAEAKGQDFKRIYVRRMAILFVIGLLHTVFLWHGDVLHDYAVLGLVLLVVRNAPKGWIFGMIALTYFVPLLRGLVPLFTHESATIPVAEVAARAHLDMRIFQTGTYWEQVAARLYQLRVMHIVNAWNAQGEPIFAMQLMTTILLGLYAGREKLLSNVEENVPRIRQITLWTFVLGAACALGASVFYMGLKPQDTVSFGEVMFNVLLHLNRPLLCIAYIGLIVLLLRKPGPRKILRMFAPAGSMPLTNYIMQSVMATTLFYSYGFGLFGRVGTLAGVGISVGIFVVQAIMSSWWSTRFHYGPLEWLWRVASYGARPPFRRTARDAAAD